MIKTAMLAEMDSQWGTWLQPYVYPGNHNLLTFLLYANDASILRLCTTIQDELTQLNDW